MQAIKQRNKKNKQGGKDKQARRQRNRKKTKINKETWTRR